MKNNNSLIRIFLLLTIVLLSINNQLAAQNKIDRLNNYSSANAAKINTGNADSFPLLKAAIKIELNNNHYLISVDTLVLVGNYNYNKIVFGIERNKIIIIKNLLKNYSKANDALYAWQFILASEQLFIANNNKDVNSQAKLNAYKYLNSLIAVMAIVNNSEDKYLLKAAIDDIKNSYYQFNLSPETKATLDAVTSHAIFSNCQNILSEYIDVDNSDRVALKEIPKHLLSNVYSQSSSNGELISYFSDKTPFYTGADNCVFLHVNRNLTGRITLNFVIRYNGNNPLLFNNVVLSIDGEKTKLPSSANFFRDNNTSNMVYKILLADGGDIYMEAKLQKLIDSETSFVELYSNDKIVTIKISRREKKAIRDVIDFYKQLKSL